MTMIFLYEIFFFIISELCDLLKWIYVFIINEFCDITIIESFVLCGITQSNLSNCHQQLFDFFINDISEYVVDDDGSDEWALGFGESDTDSDLWYKYQFNSI